jgi:hypothetical protein
MTSSLCFALQSSLSLSLSLSPCGPLSHPYPVRWPHPFEHLRCWSKKPNPPNFVCHSESCYDFKLPRFPAESISKSYTIITWKLLCSSKWKKLVQSELNFFSCHDGFTFSSRNPTLGEYETKVGFWIPNPTTYTNQFFNKCLDMYIRMLFAKSFVKITS